MNNKVYVLYDKFMNSLVATFSDEKRLADAQDTLVRRDLADEIAVYRQKMNSGLCDPDTRNVLMGLQLQAESRGPLAAYSVGGIMKHRYNTYQQHLNYFDIDRLGRDSFVLPMK